ncbi:MAG: PQQ-binding-like beta-propeller repeat protein [Chthoniobacteraceae bacterium]
MKRILLPALVLAASFITANAASNWPQWRGPAFNGAAPDGSAPTTWSETEHVKWKFKIPGEGTATPIVWEDQVFILTAIETATPDAAPAPAAAETAPAGDRPRRGPGGGSGGRSEKPTKPVQFVIISLDRKTGKPLWQKTAREQVPHEGHHPDHGFASGSPVTDGEHVFAYFGSFGLYCYDMKGNLQWEKDLGDMQTRNSFGEGSSPVLHGDTIVVNWDHEGEDFIVALDKKTGAERWRQKRDEPTTWSTPLVVEHGGKAQVVVCATNKIRSYDLATGAPIWECGGMTSNVIPTPISEAGRLYAISGFRGASLLAIQLGRTGDLTGTDAIAWQHGKGTPYVPSPLLVGGRLYFYSGNNGILSCFDAATGKPLVEAQRIEELLGGVYASPVSADGRIYLVGRDGKTVVIKQSDKIEVLATNKLDDRFDASPAIVGKDLFLRGHQSLYCIGE